MKLYACSYIDWFDYELTTEFVFAESAEAALRGWSKTKEMFPADRLLDDAPLEILKKAAFDQDAMVNAVEVPQSGESPVATAAA